MRARTQVKLVPLGLVRPEAGNVNNYESKTNVKAELDIWGLQSIAVLQCHSKKSLPGHHLTLKIAHLRQGSLK